jgi:uncharacterized iron-regulated membrane protein
MTFRHFVLVTHRWIGLASSLVLLVVGLTGAGLVWPRLLGPLERPFGTLHTRLALGEPGQWLVVAATTASALLVIGGLVLWWKRRLLRVTVRRGWWRFVFDLHHSLGFLAAVIMLIIALSGIGLTLTQYERPMSAEQDRTRRFVHRFHTGRRFPLPITWIYVLGSLAFLAQGASGVVMWWKPQVGRGEP